MAAGAFGTQTGVSLYAPTTGASLTTFRGTDGIASTRGVMPLTWGQDYAGPMARTVTDLAYLLNATTGTDPEDLLLTKDADAHRPEDWTASLDMNALKGKRIGYLPGSFVSAYANDGTGEAVKSHLADLEAAGATMVEMSAERQVAAAVLREIRQKKDGHATLSFIKISLLLMGMPFMPLH